MTYNTPIGKSLYELKPIGLGSEFLSGYAFKGKDFGLYGHPIIKIKNIQDGVVSTKDSEFIPDEVITPKLNKFKLFSKDVLIAMTGQGSVGRVGKLVISKNETPYLNQRVGKFISDEKSLNNEYLYYIISTKQYEKVLFDAGTGSGQPNLSPSIIKNIEIPFPPYVLQKKIAHILSTLDDKIELNRKMSQTLEEMAQALFKSWFVDFDPVHAKAKSNSDEELEAAAKELGISKEILELFPSEFEESELGMIPKGWEVSTIGNKLKVSLGGTPSRVNDSYWTEGTIPWINSGKVNEFRITEASELITEEAVRKSSTKLLPKKTTVLAITGATLGQVSLLEIDSCANQSVIGLPETEELNYSFVYPMISYAITDLISHQTGGAQQHINKGNVENQRIVISSKEELKEYVDIVKPILDKVEKLSFEIQTLQKTRDTLLPKLLSGELDVSELDLEV